MSACFIVPHCFSLLSQPGLRAPGARFSRILRGFHAQLCVPRIVNSLLLTMKRTLGTALLLGKPGRAREAVRTSKYRWNKELGQSPAARRPRPGGGLGTEKSWLAAPAVVYKPVNLENLARTWA